MDTDFPAAHSMDTCFFAVDRDGHVAVFDTGEAGAVPDEAFAGDTAYEARDELARALPRTELVYSLQGRACPGRSGGGQQHLPEVSEFGGMVLFLRSTDLLGEEIAAGRASPHPATEGTAVTAARLPAALFQRLHDEGVCLGCFHWYGDEDDDAERVRPAAFGVYEYGHLTENWISGPYGRELMPRVPAHVDQLPPRLRDQVKMMRFEGLSFAETPFIQPVEHVPCTSWGASYLDVTGEKVRPIPGMEEMYADEYEELEDMDLDVQRPADLDEDDV